MRQQQNLHVPERRTDKEQQKKRDRHAGRQKKNRQMDIRQTDMDGQMGRQTDKPVEMGMFGRQAIMHKY